MSVSTVRARRTRQGPGPHDTGTSTPTDWNRSQRRDGSISHGDAPCLLTPVREIFNTSTTTAAIRRLPQPFCPSIEFRRLVADCERASFPLGGDVKAVGEDMLAEQMRADQDAQLPVDQIAYFFE